MGYEGHNAVWDSGIHPWGAKLQPSFRTNILILLSDGSFFLYGLKVHLLSAMVVLATN